MRLIKVAVSNYRNIDGITVYLNDECNYLIGENNIGKSNFLSMLNTICSGKSFDDSDYGDDTKPIEILLTLKLLQEELGSLDDNFSPNDASMICIRYMQSITEPYPTIVSTDTNESIRPGSIKKINFIKYETTSIPSKELSLNQKKGAGLVMSSLISRFIDGSDEELSFLNDEQINRLLLFINGNLEKIKSFRDYTIKATIAPNSEDMLPGLFYLSDGVSDLPVGSTGSGVQFMAMASINIISRITELYKSKSIIFEDLLYSKEDGKKILPLVLSVDEPEVHLHPYLQRSLVGYYKRILKNEDPEFAELLNFCFGIDGICGQLIVVTHSTDVLIGDYRNLVRFYKNGDRTSVISGADPELDIRQENEKHLIMHFPEIKEAFYAHCAVLIEGETEYGCIRDFADKLGISLDDYGICVINARGESTINPLRRLLSKFAISSIAIYDGDVKVGCTPADGEFFTEELCFEIEIVKNLYNHGRADLVRKIALDRDSNAESVILDEDFIRKPFEKMSIDLSTYSPKKLSDVSDETEEEFVNLYSAWFMVKKGVLLGRIIGDVLTHELIPTCYADAIRKAKEVATFE